MSSFTRRQFLGAAGCTAATALLPGLLRAAPGAPKPNVIFILADDVGLDGVSCYGADKFKTPNIDALAQSGMRFETCYAMPLCGPSRAMLLSGRYPFRTGMTSNQTGNVLKPQNETLLPRPLHAAGYKTCQVGKWNQLPLQPGDWGFDEYLRFEGSGVYWGNPQQAQNLARRPNKRRQQQHSTYVVNGQTKTFDPDVYVPDMMHDFLVDFLTRHKNEPFFAYYPMSHVHGPILRTPDSKPDSDHYADNIAYMDKLVGRLMAELDRLGLRENTLVIFVGDNGTATAHHRDSTVNGQYISGYKSTMLEGGSRVPLIASWPAQLKPGQLNHDLTDFSDFFPTILELCGATPPVGVKIDGHSIAPQLRGQKGTPREWIYVELEGKYYVRDAHWKFNQAGELFDMSHAPFAEPLVPKDGASAEAGAARVRLQKVLQDLRGQTAL